MKRLYSYVTAFALVLGLTAGVYASTARVPASVASTEVLGGDGEGNVNGDGQGESGIGQSGQGQDGQGQSGQGEGGEGQGGQGQGGEDQGEGGEGQGEGGEGQGGEGQGGEGQGGEGQGGEGQGGEGEGGEGEGGTTPEPHVITGTGLFDNPYSVEDLRAIDLENHGTLKVLGVWVKAVIYGYNKGDVFSIENINVGATMPETVRYYNLVLVDEANAATPTLAQMCPTRLGTGGTDAQKTLEAVNLADNPALVGTVVYLYGDVSPYLGVNGLVNVDKYSFDGSTILPEQTPPAPTEFNLWLGNTQVTSTNASNIEAPVIASGSASYDASTKTLTLNAVTFEFNNTDNSGNAIHSTIDGLTIVINGGVTSKAMTFFLEASTTIQGGSAGSVLSFTSGRTIRAYNTSLTLNSVALRVAPGKVGLDCQGSTLKFINSVVSITACTPAILCASEPVLENCWIGSTYPAESVAFNSTEGTYFATDAESGTRKAVESLNITNVKAPITLKSCELALNTTQRTFSVAPSQVPTFSSPVATTVSGYDGTIVYASSNASIISVNEQTGQLTFNSRGTVTITVTATTTEKYHGSTLTYTVSYGKEESGLKFECGDEVTIPQGGSALQYGLYPTKNTSAAYTLTSSNNEVVYIDELRGIHFGVPGTAVLTATVPETDRFLGATVTCTVHVVESLSSDVHFAHESVTVEYGQEASFTSQKPTTAMAYNGTITFSSEHPDVATVDAATGVVTLVSPGSTRIYARASGTDSFVASSAYYTLIYSKATPKLSFSSSILNVLLSQGTAALPSIINPSGGEVKYTSSQPSVVSVDPQAGTLTLLKVGKATITASLAETDYYKSSSITCDVQVVSDGTEIAVLDIINPGLTFDATGGTKHFKLRTDRTWTASAGQSWYTVTPSSGEPTFAQGTTPTDADYIIIEVTCPANTDENSRQSLITVKAGSEKAELQVIQNGTGSTDPIEDMRLAPKLAVSPQSLNLVVTRANSTLPMLVVRYSGDDASQINFESSDASVLRVDDDGTVHVVGQGEAVLKVKASGTEFYKPAEVSVPVTATFPDPDPVEDLAPLSGTVTVNLSALADKDMSTGGVMDDIYFSMNTDLSVGDGYSDADGCIVLNSTMSAAEMETIVSQSLAELDEDGKFRGIILRVPAGTGSIVLDCKTGAHPLVVKVGASDPQLYLVSPRGERQLDYIVSEPTLVYIYATELTSAAKSLRSVRRAPKKSDATSVLIYGIKVNTVADGISGVKSDAGLDDVELYTVGGQRIAKKHAHGGVFVGTDGSKRAVK